MRQHEQALLLMAKAAEDEALVDEVLASQRVSDAIVGFHCQQAVEKLLKAVLSEIGARFRRTHNLRQLMDLLADNACPLPADLQDLDTLIPFAAALRYELAIETPGFDRAEARQKMRRLRRWVEPQIHGPRAGEGGSPPA
jgi:HEPN domain-containing protein